MPIEPPDMLAQLLAGPHGVDCLIDPDESPAGDLVRVLFDAPFLAQDQLTGEFANTRTQVYARESDVASVVPELTVLLIEGGRYTANRLEPVEGGSWRRLWLNEAT